jgi:carboxymethylenebutenolidase
MAIVADWQAVGTGNGAGFDAYIARSTSPDGQAIVLLQEIFGVNGWLRDTAEWVADQGYLVAAPDLFWRMQPRVDLGHDKESVKAAFSYRERFDEGAAVGDIAATVRHIRTTSPETKYVHLLGFCLGGKLAVLGASDRNVASAISLYGVGIENDLDALERAHCPLQLHYGGKDRFIPESAVKAVKQASAGRDIEIFVYPEANHGFFSNIRPSYDPAAADLAWSRSCDFMQRAVSS